MLGAFWVFNKIAIYYLAGSYVDEVAEVFDLNKNLANAILWATFAAILFFSGYVISISKRRRAVGLFGILLLLVGHSVIVFYGTSRQFFEKSGKATKCYVVTRDSLRYGERPGIDPTTGRECRPVTPEIVERLRAYESGTRPQRITDVDPVYFDPRTGEPITWYYRNKDGDIELFNLMGFHPDTGEELVPVSKEVVELRKSQIARRTPQHIEDPEQYGFFDQITGKPRIWFQRTPSANYDFYDGPGFDPHTGAAFSLVTSEVINEWRQYRTQSKKCYIITRDSGAPVQYNDKPGMDPVTGRECRELTPELVERLREYEKGNRPKRITVNDPTFFDPRTGEPIVWYYQNKDGDIELFDLMGFHPETGDELVPITKAAAGLWKSKQQISKSPQQVEPDKYGFFDPVTGKPKVWYWRSQTGEYEFYDNRGFHPRTGEPLLIVTSDIISKWKQENEEHARRKDEDQRRLDCELRERTQREEQRQRDEAAERESQRQAGSQCDLLAANPGDRRKAAPGVPYDDLKLHAREAIEACKSASAQYPNELRFQYQLARSLEFTDPQQAFSIHTRLVSSGYPAAFDNSGSYLLDQGKYQAAERLFRGGVGRGDPDSMVSLANMILQGKAQQPPSALALLKGAADFGHQGALQEYNILLSRQQEAERRRSSEQAMQQDILRGVGNILQNILR